MRSFLTIVFMSFAVSAVAVDFEGHAWPETESIGKTKLVLNGLGTRTATWFNVRVYAAGLYLTEKQSDPAKILADTNPKYLSMVFLRSVASEDVQKAWQEGFTQNCTEECQKDDVLLQKLKAQVVSVKEGDRMAFELTATGVTPILSRQRQQEISSPTFARNFLRIWLGAKPPNESLKAGLLSTPK